MIRDAWAALLAGGLVVAGVRLKGALDRLDAELCEWANATDVEDE